MPSLQSLLPRQWPDNFIQGIVSSLQQDLYDKLLDKCGKFRRDVMQKNTLDRSEVPPIFRSFNILTGYRPVGRHVSFYLRSFFSLHNESMNVWTHFFGAILITCEAARFYGDFRHQAAFDTFLVLIFASCSIFLHLISTVAHLMHSHSEMTHFTAFFLDHTAASLAGGSISLIRFCYTSLPEHYEAIKKWYLYTVTISALISSTALSYALVRYRRNYNWRIRVLMFVPSGLFYLWSLVPAFYKLYRYLFCGQTDVDFQWFHFLVPATFFVSMIFYISHFPENLFPGSVDIVGHSHQVFHVFITLSHVILIWVVRHDVESSHPLLASKRRFPIRPENAGLAFLLTAMSGFVISMILRLKYCRLPFNRDELESQLGALKSE